MPNATCPTCGQAMQGGDCAHCRAATAFAKPEDAEQAKVTPPAESDGAIREGEPPQASKPIEPWPYKHESGPGIYSGWGWLGCTVMAVLAIGAGGVLMLPACLALREAQIRTQSTNNMKQIALACHTYQDFHKRMPTPNMVVVKNGKDHELQLSWRVAILTHMEQDSLLKSFDLTAAWDHPKNAPLQEKMPTTYTCAHRNEPEPTRMTHIQFFTGPNTLFPDNAPRLFHKIPDGASKTLLFADAEQPVFWSRPADMVIRADQPLPLPADGMFLAAMCDGSIRGVSRPHVSDQTIRWAIDPNDGNALPSDWN